MGGADNAVLCPWDFYMDWAPFPTDAHGPVCSRERRASICQLALSPQPMEKGDLMGLVAVWVI
jgi:hypothetical protein